MARKYKNLPENAEETSAKKIAKKTLDPDFSEETEEDPIEGSSAEKIKKMEKEGCVILIRENGILKIGNSKIFAKNETWMYVLRDSSEKYILVDFDSTKVAPIAKGILNELALFPELTAIRWNIKMTYVLLFFVFMIFSGLFILVPSAEQISKQVLADYQKTAGSGAVLQQQKAQTKTAQDVIREIEERRAQNQLQDINQYKTGAIQK